MSLNCLTCGQVLHRVDSEREIEPENIAVRKVALQVERTWSGNISPPQNAALAKIKKEHRRTNSAGDNGNAAAGPRLVRSSGVRRDWNFEELTGQQDKRVRIC